MTLKLRRATFTDIPEIWDVRTRAIATGCSAHYSPADVQKWADVPLYSGFSDVIVKTEFYVVAGGGKILGCGNLDETKAEIGAMFVDPAAHRQGVGRLILNYLEGVARERRLPILKLEATLNAEAFYAKAGFRSIERNKYKHANGFELDCILMEKVIA